MYICATSCTLKLPANKCSDFPFFFVGILSLPFQSVYLFYFLASQCLTRTSSDETYSPSELSHELYHMEPVWDLYVKKGWISPSCEANDLSVILDPALSCESQH